MPARTGRTPADALPGRLADAFPGTVPSVHLAGSFAEPRALSAALASGRRRFDGLPVWTTQLHRDSPLAGIEDDGHLELRVLLSSAALARRAAAGGVRYVPCRYPDIARYLDSGLLPCDAVLVPVSPPGADGYCSLGTTVGYLKAALRAATFRVAEVNEAVPRTGGAAIVPIASFDAMITGCDPLHEMPASEPREVEKSIAAHVAAWIPDGATIEIGYGSLPNAVLAALSERVDLGVHTGTLTDGMIDLVEGGVITGARKEVDRGLLVATTTIGTRRLYDWIDGNAAVVLREATEVCDPAVLAQTPAFRAINTTLEVDLSGQANSEYLPGRLLGGYGSLAELARGARISPDGLSILALPSTNARGDHSRIVARITSPVGVTLEKLDADVVITEHGAADLRLKSPRERAAALSAVAHPKFRDSLNEATKEAFPIS